MTHDAFGRQVETVRPAAGWHKDRPAYLPCYDEACQSPMHTAYHELADSVSPTPEDLERCGYCGASGHTPAVCREPKADAAPSWQR